MNGQMSLFDGFLTEMCDTKPEIGRELVYIGEDGECPCRVDAHCGADYFHVAFTTDKMPRECIEDTNPGYHISLRGYGKSWRYK